MGKIWILGPVVIVLGLIGFMILRRGQNSGIDLSAPKVTPAKDSIYDILKRQISTSPDGDIETSELPKIRLDKKGGIAFAAGATDALFGGFADENSKSNAKKMRKLFRAINDDKVSDWRVVEVNLKGMTAVGVLDEILGKGIPTREITPQFKRLFWEVAKKSRDYECVKIGLSLGSLLIKKKEVEDLMFLGRYAEFTPFVSNSLLNNIDRMPQLKRNLIELLPVTHQWGVITLIDQIVSDKDLIADTNVQREVLIYGMKNCDGIPMEVAFTIADNIDLKTFFGEAKSDARVSEAVLDLMITLMDEPAPLGGLADLREGQLVCRQFLDIIDQLEPSVSVLGALQSMKRFLGDDDLAWPDKAQKMAQTESLWTFIFSEEVLRNGIHDERSYWQALDIVRREKVTSLLPDVVTRHSKKPDAATIQTLGRIGNREHLQILLETIPDLVDFDYRKKFPRSDVNVMGEEHKNSYEYGEIVSYLGKLGSPEAIEQIKIALNDYDRQVRLNACEAIADLDKSSIDDELRAGVQDCVNLLREAFEQETPGYWLRIKDAAILADVALPTPKKKEE